MPCNLECFSCSMSQACGVGKQVVEVMLVVVSRGHKVCVGEYVWEEREMLSN